MKAKKLDLFVFIDAFGWDILKDSKFFEQKLPHRKKLESVLGYSSTAVPTILTGRTPVEHGHFSFYYYDPANSPFKWLYPLRMLPKFLSSRARIRNKISQALKKIYGYTGYFQIYNMPFKYIHLFDYCEKKSLFAPDGMINGDNIFTALELVKVRHHKSDWRKPEAINFESLKKDIRSQSIDWAFNYNADLDAIMHVHGVGSKEAKAKVEEYKQRLEELFLLVDKHYEECNICVFSDHGMANVTGCHKLVKDVEGLGYNYGRDYVAIYDSTMARFWFMNQDARAAICDLLGQKKYGKILDPDTLKKYGALFPDAKYGELFFLLKEGEMIVPSHMGERPITAMHGYHPTDSASYASLMSNVKISKGITHIKNIYDLMLAAANQKQNAGDLQ